MNILDTALVVLFVTSICLVMHSYVLYPLCLALLDLFAKPVRLAPSRSEWRPMVSLLVAAYNEEKVIRQRVSNALSMDYPKDKFEVIIASDGSVDATNDIVSAEAAGDPRLRLFAFPERRGKVNVLNECAPQAQGEIVVFSDANAFFKTDAIHELLRPFADARVGSVCGRLVFDDGATGSARVEGLYWRLETLLKEREGRRGCLLGANGAIFAMRRDLWQSCPSDTLVEDFFIPARLLQHGHRAVYAPAAVAHEEAPPELEDEFVRRVRIGAGDFQALSRLLPLLHPRHGFAAFAFFSHKVLRWLTPHFLLLALVTNTVLAWRTGAWFIVLLALQAGFYLLALAGVKTQLATGWRRWLAPPAQFVSMNVALALGFVRWVTSTQQVTWRRTRRRAETADI